MLNYFNFKKFNGEFLLTNDTGKYIFVSKKELEDLIMGKTGPESAIGKKLCAQKFMFTESIPAFTSQNAYLMRESKNYLFAATGLHIFVVTTSCNMNCVYCQANNGITKPTDFMDCETAEKAVDVALQAPSDFLSFEFQGGEPLLNFPTIQHILEYAESRKGKKNIQYSLVSNLTLLTDEIIEVLKKYNVNVSTSLDGYEFLHNKNRPYRSGGGTYQDTLEGAHKLRKAGVSVGAIQTTTKESLSHAKDIIDAYCANGFENIFLRPLTPLGCAKQQWNEIGYLPEQFVEFYTEAIQYILEKNHQGIAIQEGHAAIFFSKILHGYPVNYMELRSPCGAAVGQMAYYANGEIFTCDEGRMLSEMGDNSFCLGNVYNSRYEDLVHSSTCRAVCLASITESIPSCCDCVYQPYCGVCPVVNLALYKDLLPKTSKHYRCDLYKGILDVLFSLLQKNDEATIKILEGWYA